MAISHENLPISNLLYIMTTDPFLPTHVPAERVVARVGLVSDTHMPDRCADFPPPLFQVLDGVDLILHAGDVGELWVLDRLSAIAPVVAVHGNDDSVDARQELPYQQVVMVAGRRILLWHSHYENWREERVSRQGNDLRPKLARSVERGVRASADVVVFGHWHIPLVWRQDGVTVINPGALASGNEVSRQLHQTVALLYLLVDGGLEVVHVDLARPGQPFVPSIDWDASFQAALNQFSASIFTPELTAAIPYLAANLSPDLVERIRLIVPNLARRVWAGELPQLDESTLLDALRQVPELSTEDKDQIDQLLRSAPWMTNTTTM